VTRVLGLDLSLTATGIAWSGGRTETITTTPKATLPRRLRTIRDTLAAGLDDDLAQRAGYPTVAVVEDLPFTRNNAAGQLGTVHGIVRVLLDDLLLVGDLAAVVLVVPGSLKRYATGNGNANKAQMLAEAIRRLDYQGSDDNQVDALWLRQLGLAHYAPGTEIPVPAKHRDALRGVEWVELAEVARA
jgi:Holliday junction resolvasome RuvABC endonuclease subunit